MDSVKFLQNPSRGLVTVARMICELLSKPKSDYLAFTLVCTLDNALKEMEDAYTYPLFKPPACERGKKQFSSDIKRNYKIIQIVRAL